MRKLRKQQKYDRLREGSPTPRLQYRRATVPDSGIVQWYPDDGPTCVQGLRHRVLVYAAYE